MQEWIETFVSQRYLPMNEVMNRLPVGMNAAAFCPRLLEARRERSLEVPLVDNRGRLFRVMLTPGIVALTDGIAEAAREVFVHAMDSGARERLLEEARIEEALGSCALDGIVCGSKRGHGLVRREEAPGDPLETAFLQLYRALCAQEGEDDASIDVGWLRSAHARLMGQENESPFRAGAVQWENGVMPHEAAHPDLIPGMMAWLCRFIAESDMHPVILACAAQFYLCSAQPFERGNGRLARLLTAKILRGRGYGFLGLASLSAELARDRGAYEKSLRDSIWEGDMTYAVERMLKAASACGIAARREMDQDALRRRIRDRLALEENLPERLRRGMEWLLDAGETTTVENWQRRWKVVNETARTDLFKLENLGLIRHEKVGKKFIFRVRRDLGEEWGWGDAPEDMGLDAM